MNIFIFFALRLNLLLLEKHSETPVTPVLLETLQCNHNSQLAFTVLKFSLKNSPDFIPEVDLKHTRPHFFHKVSAKNNLIIPGQGTRSVKVNLCETISPLFLWLPLKRQTLEVTVSPIRP